MLKSFACAALLAAAFAQSQVQAQAPAAAQNKTVTKQNEATATFTIKAIDQATRSVTLTQANGDEDTFTVGPEVTRFNQLKVGDRIKATYHESLVFQLRKPGAPAAPPTSSIAGGRLKDQPGGAIGAQQTMSVTVKAVDMKVPSLTVTTPDNRTLTRKIADAKNLEGVHPGDRIDITYTQALLVAAEPAPAK
jgi:hypothetical protein